MNQKDTHNAEKSQTAKIRYFAVCLSHRFHPNSRLQSSALSPPHSILITFHSLLLILLLLAGCGTPDDQLTLVAENEIARTQISDIRASATVVRARMQITLDFAGTRVIEVDQQGQFLRSTLVALGTDSVFISSNLPLPGNFPTFTPPPTSPVRIQVTPAPQPLVTEELNAEGTPIQVTIDPNEATNQPRFENIVLSSGVNDNDCAIDTNPRFTPASTEIYIVATGYDIPAGTSISSVWQSNGTEVALFSFQPENTVNGSCIWFFIDQTDAEFLVGTWSVELRLDGQSAAPPIPFQIVEG